MTEKNNIEKQQESTLFEDVCSIINATRNRVAVYVNSEVCLTKWYVGKRIKEDVLYNQRAEYGKQIVKNLAARLTEIYGSGWSDRSLLHCIRAAYTFTEDEIVYAVRRQFSWTHIRSLMFIDDPLKRQFYMEMCRVEHWDTRTLDAKIDSQLYERTAFNDMCNWSKMKDKKVCLPINASNEIDYTFMQHFISALEKLVIKGVVKYKDEVLNADGKALDFAVAAEPISSYGQKLES